MERAKRAVVWAFCASLAAAATWSLLGATLGQLIPPYGPPASVSDFFIAVPWAFLATLYFALFIAACAFPAYTLILLAWIGFVILNPGLVATWERRFVGYAVLALPPAVLLANGFASSTGAPFNWPEAIRIFILAEASGWSGIVLGSLVFRFRKSAFHVPAA